MRREAPKDGPQIQVERVNTAAGSTAGAGSGDFHQYRIQRRRERARVMQMEKEHEKVKKLNKKIPLLNFPIASYSRRIRARKGRETSCI